MFRLYFWLTSFGRTSMSLIPCCDAHKNPYHQKQANKFCGERWSACANMSTLNWVSKKSQKHLTSGSQSLYLSLTVQNLSLANTKRSLVPLSHRIYQMGGRSHQIFSTMDLWHSTDFNLLSSTHRREEIKLWKFNQI